MRRLVVLFLLLFAAPFSSAADPALLEKAKTEGNVAFYANITAVEPILEAFTRACGIKAEYTRLSTSKLASPPGRRIRTRPGSSWITGSPRRP